MAENFVRQLAIME